MPNIEQTFVFLFRAYQCDFVLVY